MTRRITCQKTSCRSGRTRRGHTRGLIIALDGPAGSGKSSTAKALAKRIKVPFIDTGAMYRAVTLKAMRKNISFKDVGALRRIAKSASIRLAGRDPKKQKVFLDAKDVTQAIRLPQVTQNVFYVAREPQIRGELVKKQREMGREKGGVMEGRDIGTVVFPKADYKFYFEADPRVRARRRLKELIAAGQHATFREVLFDIQKRDKSDFERKVGPLKRAEDAIFVDTSSLTIDDTVDKILAIIQSNPLKNRRLSSAIEA